MNERIDLGTAFNTFVDEYKKRYGDDAIIEEDETQVVMFNNCIMIVTNIDGTIKVNITAEEPFHIDNSINVYTESSDDVSEIL